MNMKLKMPLFFTVVLSVALLGCSDDNEVKQKGDPDLNHEGDKWTITSVDYNLIDQSTTGQTFKNGTKANAGSFYFVPGGEKGSFEMNVEGYNKEDAFNYTMNMDNGEVSIVDIEQSAGTQTNQNVVVLTGDVSGTEMSLDGTITKQSTAGQFILTLSMTLTKN